MLSLLLLPAVSVLRADDLAPLLRIVPAGTDPGGQPTLQLGWEAIPGASYYLHAREGLETNAPWQPVRPFQAPRTNLPSVTLGTLIAATNPGSYFQLTAPAVSVTGLEPIPLSGTPGQFLFVLGQFLNTNVVVTIDGVAAVTEWLDANTLRVALPVLGAGRYSLQVRDGTRVLADLPQALPVTTSGLEEEVPTGSPAAAPTDDVKDSTRGGRPGPVHGWGVTASGEFQVRALDLVIRAGYGPDFVLSRTYRSKMGATNGPLGPGWSLSYDVRIEVAGSAVVVHDGCGRADSLHLQPDGTYRRPGLFREGAFSNDVFTLTFADRSRWIFHTLSHPTAGGRLAASVDRNGNTMRFHYDGAGRLDEVVDAPGRTNRFFHDASGRLTNVTDFVGRQVVYQYYASGEPGGQEGDLKNMTSPAVTGTPTGNDFPAGLTSTYAYAKTSAVARLNHQLAAIHDPSGTALVQLQYTATADPADFEFDRVRSVGLGTNTPTVYAYEPLSPAASNAFARTKLLINDPVGNLTEQFHDARNRPVTVRQWTGRCAPGLAVSSLGNRPKNPLRPGDPAYFETRFDWNLDSLPLRVTSPRGGRLERVFEGDLNPGTPARLRGNVRELRHYPAPGAPADQEIRLERFEYLPGFGITENEARNFAPVQIRGTGHVLRHVMASRRGMTTRYQDPRGHAWEYACDDRGNLTNVQPPGVSSGHAVEYNPQGQPIAHVHPADAAGRRRRDTFSYASQGVKRGYADVVVVGSGSISNPNLLTRFEPDAVGNITNLIDANGNDTQFVYNQLDQPVLRKSAPAGGGQRIESTCHYAPAAIVRRTHWAQQIAGAYENARAGGDSPLESGASRYRTITEEDLPFPIEWGGTGGSASSARLFQVTDAHLDEQGVPVGNGVLRASFAHDDIGQLTAMINAAGDVTALERDANGRVTRVLTPLAVSGAEPSSTVDQSHDERGLPFRVVRAAGSAVQCTTQFDYDADGHRRRVSEGLEGATRVTTTDWDGFSMSSHLSGVNRVPSTRCLDWSSASIRSGEGGTATNAIEMDQANLQLGRMAVEDAISDRLRSGEPLSLIKQQKQAEFAQVDVDKEVWRQDFGQVNSGHDERRSEAHVLPPGADMGGGVVKSTGLSLAGAHPCTYTHANGGGAWNEGDAQMLSTPSIEGANPSARPARITDGMGNVTQFHYDPSGNPLQAERQGEPTDLPGSAGNITLARTEYAYDALNRLTRVHRVNLPQANGNPAAPGEVLGFALAPNGQCAAFTNGNGHVTLLAYDAAGRLTLVTDPKGNRTAFTHDAKGNVLVVTNRLKSDLGSPDLVLVQTRVHDKLNRCTAIADNVGNATTLAYNSLGRVVLRAEAGSGLVRFLYDNLQSRTAVGRDLDGDGDVFGPGDLVTRWSWDPNRRLVTRTDANTNLTRFVHTPVGDLATVLHPDGTRVQFTRNLFGEVEASVDANGTQVSSTYDAAGRLRSKAVTPGAGVAADTTWEEFAHDGLGRLVFAANNTATNRFTHDSLGRLLTEDRDGATLTNAYDAAGNRVLRIAPGGRVLGYTYDAANLCRSVSLLADPAGAPTGLLASNAWLGHRLERRTRANGTVTTLAYNGGLGTQPMPGDRGWGQVSLVQHQHTNGMLLDRRVLAHDAAQRRARLLASAAGQPARQHDWRHDAAGRLTNTVVLTNGLPARQTGYVLDKAGNRRDVTGDLNPGSYLLDPTTPEPADFQVNQYTTTPLGDFTYDRNGNRVSEGGGGLPGRLYEYDYRNRLVSVRDGVTGQELARYAYDALGRRIRRVQFMPDLVTTVSFHDGARVVQQDTLTAAGMVRATHDDAANGGLIRRDGTNYWPHADDQASTRVFSLDNGSVVERIEYGDYGGVSFTDAAGQPAARSAAGQPPLYQGAQHDDETSFLSVNPLHESHGQVYHVQGLDEMGELDAIERMSVPGLILDPRVGSPLQRDPGGMSEKAEVRTEKIKFKQDFGPTQATKRL